LRGGSQEWGIALTKAVLLLLGYRVFFFLCVSLSRPRTLLYLLFVVVPATLRFLIFPQSNSPLGLLVVAGAPEKPRRCRIADRQCVEEREGAKTEAKKRWDRRVADT
jgi:hypothetical protein